MAVQRGENKAGGLFQHPAIARHPCAELCRVEHIEYGNAHMVSLARTIHEAHGAMKTEHHVCARGRGARRHR